MNGWMDGGHSHGDRHTHTVHVHSGGERENSRDLVGVTMLVKAK
jgi:hypothetical protein